MRRNALVLLICSLAVGANAQQATFKSGVTLVTVDVTVLDKDGKPVPGLAPEDFEVKLNGKVVPVKALTFLQASAGSPAAQGAPAVPPPARRTTITNAGPVTPGAEPRLFVVLLDDLSFTPGRGKGLFTAAQKFVSGLPATDLVGFTSSSGSTPTVNPTPDRAAVRAALNKAVGQYTDPVTINNQLPVVGVTEAVEIDLGNNGLLTSVITRDCGAAAAASNVAAANSDCAANVARAARSTAAMARVTTANQMLSFEQVIKAMGMATGIKHLVVLTNGLAITRDLTGLGPVARAAAAAGVQLSIMLDDPRDVGMESPNIDIDAAVAAAASGASTAYEPTLEKVRREDGVTLVNGMETVAGMTGGTVYRVIGQPDRFFDSVQVAASAVYRLGVDEPAGTAKGKDFTVSARVVKPGLSVKANRTAVPPAAEGPAPVMPVEDQLLSALSVGASRYGVPISLATALRHTPGSTQVELGLNISIPSSVPGPLTAVFALVDDTGATRSGRKVVNAPADTSAFRLAFNLPVAPGVYRLRFAVADANGAVGSLESVVSAKLTTMGPFTSSDLLTSWIGKDDSIQFLALEDVPAEVKTLNTTLELYPAADAPVPDNVIVTLSLEAAGAPVGSKPIVLKQIDPDSGKGLLRADTALPFDTLAPGVYIIRGKVSIGGNEVGSTSATVRKK